MTETRDPGGRAGRRSDDETERLAELRDDATRRPGDDVGGPASAFQSGVEGSMSSPAEDDQPDSQARNPL